LVPRTSSRFLPAALPALLEALEPAAALLLLLLLLEHAARPMLASAIATALVTITG